MFKAEQHLELESGCLSRSTDDVHQDVRNSVVTVVTCHFSSTKCPNQFRNLPRFCRSVKVILHIG